jgi:hypothetical protein
MCTSFLAAFFLEMMTAKYRSRAHKRSSTSMKNVYYSYSTKRHNLHSFSPLPPGSTTTAQAINCRFFTAFWVKSRGSHVAFMNKLALGEFSLPAPQFSQSLITPPVFHTHLSPGVSTMSPFLSSVSLD